MSSQSNDITEGFKMTELGPLPEEWDSVRLDQLMKLRAEGVLPENMPDTRYVGLEHLDPGESKLRRWGNIQQVRSSKSRFYPDDILYGKLRPYLDKAALAEWDGVCSTDILVFSSYTNNVVPAYIVNLLHTKPFIDHAIATTSGVNHPRTSWSSLRSYIAPYPPLPEQKAIARVLSTIQKAGEAQDKIISAARELKKSLMRHLFTYGPVLVAEAEQVTLKDTEIGPVPEHWEVVRLETASDIIMGQAPSSNTYNAEGLGLPFFQGKADFGDIYPTPRKWCSAPAKIAEKDDVLLSVRAPIGDVNIAEERCCIGRGLASIRANEKAEGKYLFYRLAFSKEMLESKGTGTTFKEINKAAITSFVLPLPPLSEQKTISLTLSSVDNKIEAEEKRKAASQALFKTMLHQLMTGKVRVKDLEATAA